MSEYRKESSYLSNEERKEIVDCLLKRMWEKGYQNIFPEKKWILDFIKEM